MGGTAGREGCINNLRDAPCRDIRAPRRAVLDFIVAHQAGMAATLTALQRGGGSRLLLGDLEAGLLSRNHDGTFSLTEAGRRRKTSPCEAPINHRHHAALSALKADL
jgi:hypothetical protein